MNKKLHSILDRLSNKNWTSKDERHAIEFLIVFLTIVALIRLIRVMI